MLSREDIREMARVEQELYQRIISTFAKRDTSEKARQAWLEATSAWHARRSPVLERLWGRAYLEELRASDPAAVADAILFLEVDPWFHRSGYLKERLIRGLKTAQLSDRDKLRLRQLVWNVAAGRNRREFRNYCSLAAVVVDEDFIRRLARVTPQQDLKAQGKFVFLLECLMRHQRVIQMVGQERREYLRTRQRHVIELTRSAFAKCRKPREDQLTSWGGLDGPYVVEHWKDHDRDSVLRLDDYGGCLAEDLSYMSSHALRYFLPAVMELMLLKPDWVECYAFGMTVSRLEGLVGLNEHHEGGFYRPVVLDHDQRVALREFCKLLQDTIKVYDLVPYVPHYKRRLAEVEKRMMSFKCSADYDAELFGGRPRVR
ncbi:hypothetical protein Rhal01_03743 [Rubritalea halochordaticola]|uniref:Uncharacterized protein n=1 Tax=Rubritalea halochordaticola TaxID=714537 RepID=A0ABP9V4G2_9BACT